MNDNTYNPQLIMGGGLSGVKDDLGRSMRKSPTVAGRFLWRRIKSGRIAGYHFRRQHPKLGFIPDFYCHALRLIIEVDGSVHEEHAEYDNERDALLCSAGYSVLRFSNHDVVNNLEMLVGKIHAKIRELR